MSIDKAAMFLDAFEQMRRVGWRNSLSREMAADVQIRGIFPLLDDLMMLFRLANCILLRANVIRETLVARLVISAHFSDVLFNRGQFFLRRCEFFLYDAGRVACAESRAHKLSAFIRQTRAACADRGGLRVQIGGRRGLRLKLGKFLEQLLVGGVVVANAM